VDELDDSVLFGGVSCWLFASNQYRGFREESVFSEHRLIDTVDCPELKIGCTKGDKEILAGGIT